MHIQLSISREQPEQTTKVLHPVGVQASKLLVSRPHLHFRIGVWNLHRKRDICFAEAPMASFSALIGAFRITMSGTVDASAALWQLAWLPCLFHVPHAGFLGDDRDISII